MAVKARIFQLQGNLQEAAKLLVGISEQSPTLETFDIKITQLRLERKYGEAIRLLQAHLAQFHFASPDDMGIEQVALAFMQRLAGDTAGAKVTAEQARNTLEQLYRDRPDNVGGAVTLSQVYAAIGEKDTALKAAEQDHAFGPSAKDAMTGPAWKRTRHNSGQFRRE
jgi:hypothetical protein